MSTETVHEIVSRHFANDVAPLGWRPNQKEETMITGIKRDVTRALNALLGARNTVVAAARGYEQNATAKDNFIDVAVAILRDLDARTGRKDPSKRRRPAKRAKTAKRATKKASRSSRRR